VVIAQDYRMYIDGAWAGAQDGGVYEIINPATERAIASVPNASPEDMRRAIAAARHAFDEGPWPRTARSERGRVLEQIAQRLEARKDALRELLISEVGCAQFLLGIQLDDPLAFLHHYAELARTLELEERLPSITQATPTGTHETQLLVNYQPTGVVGAINTWNFPLFVLLQKLGPALAAGCTMVVKTSPFAPLLNLEVAKAIEETGLPAGVFNVVTGESTALGEELVSSPLIDKISFTGSVPTGKRIVAAAAQHLTRVHLELGGKSPVILLDDADIDRAAPGLASATYIHAGQGCALHTRCLVPDSLYDSVMEKMVGFVRNVKIGDPADASVMLGPLIREERRRAVEEFIESGSAEGARLETGGRRPDGLDRGFFLEPTIFGEVRNDMRIAREEIFGPVLAVTPYKDIDDAVRIANDSRYGLSARIVTSNQQRGIDVAKRLRTGSVLISEGIAGPGSATFMTAPFGGFKESGIGREGGKYGVFEFTEIQSIAW
jgi:aldehyde dehydrogenase (NAD+)